jgi:fatty acid-binding protein DegV
VIAMEWLSKHIKWLFWGLIAAVTVFLTVIFKGLKVEPKEGVRKKKTSIPPLPEKVKKRVQHAEEQALVVRAKAKAREQVQLEQLETIRKIDNDAERRKRLAELMATL